MFIIIIIIIIYLYSISNENVKQTNKFHFLNDMHKISICLISLYLLNKI